MSCTTFTLSAIHGTLYVSVTSSVSESLILRNHVPTMVYISHWQGNGFALRYCIIKSHAEFDQRVGWQMCIQFDTSVHNGRRYISVAMRVCTYVWVMADYTQVSMRFIIACGGPIYRPYE